MFIIKSMEDLELICKTVKWQDFEKLVAFIFEKNGFIVKHNVVVVFNDTKRQFDVLAKLHGLVYAAECKRLKNSPSAKDMLKHIERCKMLSVSIGKKVKPLIITLNHELMNQTIPIIPIQKLNYFLNLDF